VPVAAAVSVDSVLYTYRQFMRVLQLERARRGTDPWHECPLTLPQLRALSLIVNADHGRSSRELAEHLGVGASAVTPLVDRLVERGYVERHEDPRDRRVTRLQATDRGVAMLDGWHAIQSDIMRDALQQLSPVELETVNAALLVLRGALERSSTPPQPSSPCPQGMPA
jgi:DNA-binding MarR family transcriptional regulator